MCTEFMACKVYYYYINRIQVGSHDTVFKKINSNPVRRYSAWKYMSATVLPFSHFCCMRIALL